MKIDESFARLEEYIIKEDYRGYDPYDILLSSIPFIKVGKWFSVIVTQIHKRNPINIRYLLGIKKGINPKAFGLFLQAYSILYQRTYNSKYLDRASYFFDWLNNNYSKHYSGKCWGYNFPWATTKKYVDAYVPSSVVTGFVVKGLYEYYKITNNPKAQDLIVSACLFLDNDLQKLENKTGISISYTPVEKDICYNASLLAAESFAKAYVLCGNERYKILAEKAVEFVIDKQHPDGKWNYSVDLDLQKEEEQIDFHQGYILESIFEIKSVLKIEKKTWDIALEKGLEFYTEKQFHSSGRGYWRLPKEYPVEIHNQSQGIITMLKLKDYYAGAIEIACRIASWSIENMQAKDGHFFYQMFQTHANKISYMRWNNAWMFLALSRLIT